jgi:hypothetical protein
MWICYCCVIKNGLEVCSDCKEYPCSRFDSERKGYDSFVTHRKIFTNLDYIKSKRIGSFIDLQKIRMNILSDFLVNYDDGRSKSFFCISCALLPLDELQETHSLMNSLDDSLYIKEKNKRLKDKLQTSAEKLKIDLKLNNKK